MRSIAQRQGLTLAICLIMTSFLAVFSLTGVAKAATPEEELARINASVDKALDSARSGRVGIAQSHYKFYERGWFQAEDAIRESSTNAYRSIEQKMLAVGDAFALKDSDSTKQAQVIAALESLSNLNKQYAANGLKSAGSAATTGITMASVLANLKRAQQLVEENNFEGAAKEIKQFQSDWLEVEGQVKTRSGSDYSDTENDMALAYQLARQSSPEAKTVIERLATRLEPYRNAAGYGIFDALLILLREGLEALLVIVALLTFLKKSGNADKQAWIWVGTGAGLAVSVILAVAIQLLFSSLQNGSNRELIEGFTGLFAAVMLLYVSYWMHSKSSAANWNKYIKQQSTKALASGSLFGLALLAFLAIFREGAETALFYFGIASSISLSDLLIGLGIGSVILLVIGVLMVVVGVRLPIGPFFTVASVLVFYLCFKFIGMGVHALQIAGFLPASSAKYLPASDFLGMYPTWETTIPQFILLAVGIGTVIFTRIKDATANRATSADSQSAPV